MTDRALDIQVAELVMGWTKVCERMDGHTRGTLPNGEQDAILSEYTCAGGVGEVLDRLLELGYKAKVKSYKARHRVGGFIPTMWKVTLIRNNRFWCKRSRNLGRAVCNAALAAIEDREE